MFLGVKKIGMVGMAAGLVFITGCTDVMGPASGESAPVQSSVLKSSAHTSDSSSVGVSLGRMGTVTLNANFKSTNP